MVPSIQVKQDVHKMCRVLQYMLVRQFKKELVNDKKELGLSRVYQKFRVVRLHINIECDC